LVVTFLDGRPGICGWKGKTNSDGLVTTKRKAASEVGREMRDQDDDLPDGASVSLELAIVDLNGAVWHEGSFSKRQTGAPSRKSLASVAAA